MSSLVLASQRAANGNSSSNFGRIGSLKHFSRERPRLAARPRRVRRPQRAAAARRSAVAHGLDRHRCEGGRFQRGFYTHFKTSPLEEYLDTEAPKAAPATLNDLQSQPLRYGMSR